MKKSKSIFKKILGLFTLAFICFVGVGKVHAAENIQPSLTPELYIQFLENYSTITALESGIDYENVEKAKIQASETLKGFKKLTSEQQEIFIEIISNPEIMKAALNGTTSNLKSLDKYSKYITFEATEETLENIPTMRASVRTVSHSGNLSVFGLPMTKYTVEGKYEYNSKGATSALSARGWVDFQLNPLFPTSLTSIDKYVSGGKFYLDAVFNYQIGINGIGGIIQIGNLFIGLTANHNGKINGYFHR